MALAPRAAVLPRARVRAGAPCQLLERGQVLLGRRCYSARAKLLNSPAEKGSKPCVFTSSSPKPGVDSGRSLAILLAEGSRSSMDPRLPLA